MYIKKEEIKRDQNYDTQARTKAPKSRVDTISVFGKMKKRFRFKVMVYVSIDLIDV